LRAAEPASRALSVAVLAERLASAGDGGVPLLVVRVPALERTAWRDGRRAARAIERRVAAAFTTAVARVLRADDLIAHDAGTDAFLAALVTPMRDGQRGLAPVDVRSALARIAATVEGLTQLDVDAGWTRYDAGEGAIDRAIARALARGAQERERYAFFSAVGHELRTPLSSIRGYLETLLADDADAATRRRFVGIAYNESLRLTRLLEGMFEISLLDLSPAYAPAARAALDAVLAGVADACAANARARAVTLRFPAAPAVAVAVDADRLTLVLINLVDNAIKHGRAGGTVSVACEAAPARSITIVVDDDGPGVAEAERERIFALGERGATGVDGSGIGLALVRMILERAGGRVEAGAAPQGGARFTVVLPRAEFPASASKPRTGGQAL
jgi:signal transduction histidine kinase